jgi:hypothetical protein
MENCSSLPRSGPSFQVNATIECLDRVKKDTEKTNITLARKLSSSNLFVLLSKKYQS